MLDTLFGTSRTRELAQYLDGWATAHMSCARADRPMAEEGVRLAYDAAGLRPPQRIVWCNGPIEIANNLGSASFRDQIGANVKAEIFDQVQSKVGNFAEVFWKEVVVAATRLGEGAHVGDTVGRYDRCKDVNRAVGRLVHAAADDVLSGLALRARHALLRVRGLPRLLPRGGFATVAVGPHELGSLGVYAYLHDALSWREPVKALRGLWQIGNSAGWIVPHEHVCWLAERPTHLHADAKGRLHCPDGPALRYPDGWSVYAWKGVQVPAWAIERPEAITPRTISDTWDPVLRNCMIEIMTPERFVSSGGVTRVSEDKTGVLWRKSWSFRGVSIGSWSAVEVVNATANSDGTHERYFLRVPPGMRTACEAVAWTYGLSSAQYAELDLRT
jgi:hypothetical protein